MTSAPADTAKRSDIITAAIAEFRKRGFGGARVDEIAERAKVSKRTLYRYFPSKEDLFDAIVKLALTLHPPGMDGSYDPVRPLEDQLRELVDAYLDIVSQSQYIALARVVTVEFIHQPKLARLAEKSAPENRFERFIAAAMQAGAMRVADAGEAATQLTGLLKVFFFWPPFFEDAPPLNLEKHARLRDDCLTMFLTHYQIK